MNPTNPIIDPELESILNSWVEAQKAASQWTAREKELRQSIFNRLFPEPIEGANNFKRLPFDKTLVGDYRINYTADKGLLDAEIALGKKSNLRPLIDQVINWRPEVRAGELNKLGTEDKRALAPFITSKPGLPALEFKTTSRMRKGK